MNPSIYESKCRYWVTRLLIVIYSLNDRLLGSEWLELKLWDLLRFQLFWVAGGCQHSGNCCRHLMLMVDRKTIESTDDFEALIQRKPEHARFRPQTSGAKIDCFSCTKLTDHNTCGDYANRPQLCRNYPASNFIMGQDLYSGCGYYIALKAPLPVIRNPRLIIRMETVGYR